MYHEYRATKPKRTSLEMLHIKVQRNTVGQGADGVAAIDTLLLNRRCKPN